MYLNFTFLRINHELPELLNHLCSRFNHLDHVRYLICLLWELYHALIKNEVFQYHTYLFKKLFPDLLLLLILLLHVFVADF